MRTVLMPLVFAAAVLAAQPSDAGSLYKCVDASGYATYQQTPCPDAADESVREVRENVYPTPKEQAEIARTRRDAAKAQDILRRAAGRTLPHERPPIVEFVEVAPARPQRRGRPEPGAFECTKPDGSVYYSASGCGKSTVYGDPVERDWRRDQVSGLPGAVMAGPDTAIDPRTGQTIHLLHEARTVTPFATVPDDAAIVPRREACEGQRAVAKARRDREWRTLSALERRKLDQEIRTLCD